MTAYDIMISLRRAGDEISDIQEKIDMWRDAVTTVTAGYGESGGHGGGETDRMAAYAARVDSLLDQMAERAARRQKEMEVCLNLCEEYTGIERTILYSYYAKAWTLEAIAAGGSYAPAYVRKRKAALDEQLKTIMIEDMDDDERN